MAKKKRKSAKRSKLAAGVQSAFGAAGRLLLKLVPAVVLGLLVLFGFFKVRDVLYADPALEIRQIRILPADALPLPLKAELEKQWLGRNIFSADVRQISRFLARDPNVFKAEAVKKFPSTLTVTITQRVPFARVRFTHDGATALISEDGMILDREEDEARAFEGPALDAFETSWKKPVRGALMAPKGFNQTVQFYQQFQHHPLAAHETLTRLSLDYLGDLTVTLGDGPDVKLGRRPVEMMKQLQKLDPFLDPAERPKIQYIDLQFEDVVVKRKGK